MSSILKIKPYIYSIIVSISFCYLMSIPISNVFVLLCVFICLSILFCRLETQKDTYVVVLSIILSFLIILGRYLIYVDESSGVELAIKIILTPIGTYILFSKLLSFLFISLDKIKVENKFHTSLIKLFIFSFVVILLSYIPLWIAEYPGIYTPDTITQIGQAVGLYRLNNMNPLLHTFFISVIYNILSTKIVDINLCFFIISFIQAFINSFIFAYVSIYVYKKTHSKVIYLFTLIFFSFISFNAFYSITLSKDSAYAAFTALFLICIDKLFEEQNIKNIIMFIAIGITYSLLRSNGYYSLFFLILILLILFIKKIVNKKIVICFLVVLATSTIIMFPVYSLITKQKVEKNSNQTVEGYKFKGNFLYVIPFQQVANVVVHDRELNEKEQWLIEEYIPLDKVKDVYNPILVDPLFDYITNHFKPTRGDIDNFEYIKLWIELLLKYPHDYLEAYVNMTKYYFYPARYVNMYYVDIYNNDLGIAKSSNLFGNYKESIENFYNVQKDLPFIGSIMSPGVSVYIMIITIFYCLRRKKYISLYCMMPLLANFLILMVFVPINDEFRYIYPIVVCLPIIVAHLLSKERKEYEKKCL